MHLVVLCVCISKLTGGVLIVNSFVNLSVKPGSSELPPTEIIPLYKLYKKCSHLQLGTNVFLSS